MLKELSTEEETLDKMVEIINHAELKAEDLKIAGSLLYKKLQAAYFYEPNNIYNGEIRLIKTKENFIHLKNDYGLSEVIVTFKHIKHIKHIKHKLALILLSFLMRLIIFLLFADLQKPSTD